jgi:hypothetical protein
MPRFHVELARVTNPDCGTIVIRARDRAQAGEKAISLAETGSAKIEWSEGDEVRDFYVTDVVNLDASPAVDYTKDWGCAIERAFGDGNDLGG